MKDIVQFKNGKYGIRRRSFIQKIFNQNGSFLDFTNPTLWWDKNSRFFKDCQIESLDEVVNKYEIMTNPVLKVIKP